MTTRAHAERIATVIATGRSRGPAGDEEAEMGSTLNPYLRFTDSAGEAIRFYADVFGGEPVMTTFGESGLDGPGSERVMHAQLSTPSGYLLMASDTPPGVPDQPTSGTAISLSGDDPALVDYWTRLGEGGTVAVPLERQSWGDEFGMVVDRYGITWMVNISAA